MKATTQPKPARAVDLLGDLAEVARLVNLANPLDETLTLLAEKARQMVGAQFAALCLAAGPGRPQPSALGSVAPELGLEPAAIGRLVEFQLVQQASRSRRALRLTQTELEAHPAWQSWDDEPLKQTLKGWLGVPLVQADGSHLGVLAAACRKRGQFKPEDETVLAPLVQLAILAIEHQRLDRAEQRARQVAETLRVANLALNQKLNLQAVLETLLDYLGWIVPYDTASVMLLKSNTQVEIRAARSYVTVDDATPVEPVAVSIADNVTLQSLINSQRCLVIPDTGAQPVWEQHRTQAHSWLGIPLVTDGKVIGLCAIEKETIDFFNEEHVRLSEALATQAAVAIENAGLFAALQDSEEHYRAATELASDYAYAFRVEPNGQFVREWVTEAFTRITGFAPDEVDTLGGWISLAHTDDLSIALRHMQMLTSGQPSVCDYRIMTKSGELRWLRDHSRPVWDDAAGRVIGIYGAAQDITARKQHERELEAVANIASALRTATTHTEMLPVILEQTTRLLNAEGVAVALRDTITMETVIELGRGGWLDWIGQRHPPGEGISGHVINSGRPYLNNDAPNDPIRARSELLGELKAVACVPLIAQEETIGALWMGRHTAILDSEVRLLNAIADIAANAIRRAALHEQTEGRLQHLVALRSIDRAITASLDLNVTLDILLDQLTSQLGVHAADILLFDPVTQTLEFASGRGFRSSAVKRSHLHLGRGYAGRVALERKTMHQTDLPKNDPALEGAPLLTSEGFVAYHGLPLITKGQLKGVLEVFHRTNLAPDPEWFDFLEMLAGQAAIAVENAQLFEGLQRSNLKLMMAYDATIEGWSRALELRDKETEGHSQRVTEMTLRLARAMDMSESELVHVRRGALLHDIGKMGIPDAILLRPGPLTDVEWEVMRQHPNYAYQMLMPIEYLRPALDVPYCHHERWDGSGYPRGLKGEQIPLAARIFAITDVWDALRSDRPYGHAWPLEKVLQHLRDQAGKHFDPKVVETFFRLYDSNKLFG